MADIIRILEKIRESGMKLKGRKCGFARKKIKLLGFIVSKLGIEPDPEKIEGIEVWGDTHEQKRSEIILGSRWILSKMHKGFCENCHPNDGTPEIGEQIDLGR